VMRSTETLNWRWSLSRIRFESLGPPKAPRKTFQRGRGVLLPSGPYFITFFSWAFPMSP
jgi:hypothetical protein